MQDDRHKICDSTLLEYCLGGGVEKRWELLLLLKMIFLEPLGWGLKWIGATPTKLDSSSFLGVSLEFSNKHPTSFYRRVPEGVKYGKSSWHTVYHVVYRSFTLIFTAMLSQKNTRLYLWDNWTNLMQ